MNFDLKALVFFSVLVLAEQVRANCSNDAYTFSLSALFCSNIIPLYLVLLGQGIIEKYTTQNIVSFLIHTYPFVTTFIILADVVALFSNAPRHFTHAYLHTKTLLSKTKSN